VAVGDSAEDVINRGGINQNDEAVKALIALGYDDADEKGNYDVSHSSAVYVFDRQGQARLLVRPDQSLEALRSDLTALAKEGA
jgi:cytochrome oxidase Cu insertion factor (SCO1/SenC/PrrC family)